MREVGSHLTKSDHDEVTLKHGWAFWSSMRKSGAYHIKLFAKRIRHGEVRIHRHSLMELPSYPRKLYPSSRPTGPPLLSPVPEPMIRPVPVRGSKMSIRLRMTTSQSTTCTYRQLRRVLNGFIIRVSVRIKVTRFKFRLTDHGDLAGL